VNRQCGGRTEPSGANAAPRPAVGGCLNAPWTPPSRYYRTAQSPRAASDHETPRCGSPPRAHCVSRSRCVAACAGASFRRGPADPPGGSHPAPDPARDPVQPCVPPAASSPAGRELSEGQRAILGVVGPSLFFRYPRDACMERCLAVDPPYGTPACPDAFDCALAQRLSDLGRTDTPAPEACSEAAQGECCAAKARCFADECGWSDELAGACPAGGT